MSKFIEHMLGDQEKILFFTHRHWLSLLRMIFLEITVIIFITTGIILVVVQRSTSNWLWVLFIIPLVSMAHDVLVFMNHQYVITDRRVIQVSGVLNKNVSDSSIEKVNDIHLAQSFWGRIFDFGDIKILTANEVGDNFFKMINHPVRFKSALLRSKNGYVSATPQPQLDVPRLLRELGDLRDRGLITEEEFLEKKQKYIADL